MKINRSILAILLIAISINGYGQDEKYFSLFYGRTFYKPFVSEISSTLSNISIGGVRNTLPSGTINNTAFTEVHLGADIPILYSEKKSFRWALSIPVSMHMLWATFEETTAPIVNTDYRFGLSFTGITYLNNSFLKNISFKVTPIAHESTHIGDEITIYGFQNIANFYRVNVSYEYYELGITLNDPDTLSTNLLSVRLGLMGLINPTKGYYSFFENEIGDKPVFPSKRWAEYYIELNYYKNTGFLTSETWKPSISIELRNRVKYEYENEGKSDREWCINAFIGYDFVPKRTKVIKSVGHYFRFYSGLNPHGQFRNIYYRFIGYSIVLFY
ncbi:MAG: hypothetical protein QM503_05240 [Bacteroidota bacterium]